MDKILFRINIQSVSDIITNSSSELFVFQKPSVKDVAKLLDDYVPGWREEYEEPILFSDMGNDNQCEYIGWVFPMPNFYNYDDIEEYNKVVIKIVHRELCISEEEIPSLFTNWNQPVTSENGNYVWTYYDLEWSEKGLNILKDKYKYDICLWSIDENPDYARQEVIKNIVGGKRYHLG